ncbi:MAG: polysaccharide biosynthesis/export family protein [Acidiferrobacterales bacterium]
MTILRAFVGFIMLGVLHATSAQDKSSVDASYLIGPEDVLQISVWKEEGLEREVLVGPDGWVTFPLAGNIRAAGKTASQLQRELTKRLKKYISGPVVTVSVSRVVGNKIYVIGAVTTPGEYIIGRYVDVVQALALAGGLTPAAAQDNIKIVRKEGDQELVINFDYEAVKQGRDLEQNVMLKSGDTVVVLRGVKRIYVIGQVRTAGEYPIERSVDVMQALALAGGLTPFAVEKKIKILRKQGSKEKVIAFDYEAVKQGRKLEQNIFLKNGDVVVVP